jgi:hypothetical protein
MFGYIDDAGKFLDDSISQLTDLSILAVLNDVRNVLDQLYYLKNKLAENMSRAGYSQGQMTVSMSSTPLWRIKQKMQSNGSVENMVQGYIAIPQEDEYRISEKFQREISRGAQEKRPKEYEEFVGKYYEEVGR